MIPNTPNNMKNENNESILRHSLRAFSVAAFGVIGVIIGCLLLIFILAFGLNALDKGSFSSNVKIMPDHLGNRKELPSTTPVLFVVPFQGVIGVDGLSASKIENILLKSREGDFKKDRVKGILLLMNTPGGSANDSDIIYRLMKDYKEQHKVPIYTFVQGLCASGGYYISCAADKIYASPVSLIGSIGVVSTPFFNVSDTIKKLGVEALTLSEGKDKDQMNPFRPWKEDEQKNYKQILSFYYDVFVDIVAQNRPLIPKEKLVCEYGAHVFPAPIAKENGYIDVASCEYKEAIKDLSLAAGIKEGEKYQVVKIDTKDWYQKIFEEKTVHHEIDLSSNLKNQASVNYLYNP